MFYLYGRFHIKKIDQEIEAMRTNAAAAMELEKDTIIKLRSKR